MDLTGWLPSFLFVFGGAFFVKGLLEAIDGTNAPTPREVRVGMGWGLLKTFVGIALFWAVSAMSR